MNQSDISKHRESHLCREIVPYNTLGIRYEPKQEITRKGPKGYLMGPSSYDLYYGDQFLESLSTYSDAITMKTNLQNMKLEDFTQRFPRVKIDTFDPKKIKGKGNFDYLTVTHLHGLPVFRLSKEF